jgi:hypothetical protein
MYTDWSKPIKWRSQEYRDFVSERPCINLSCPGWPGVSDPHHHGEDSGTSTKASDIYLIPLCHACHVAYHNGNLQVDLDYAQSYMLKLLNEFLFRKGAPK